MAFAPLDPPENPPQGTEAAALSAARQLAEEAAAFAPAPPRDRLRLRGADALTFLHGQCTQAILGREPGSGGYAFCLNPRGQVLADLRFSILSKSEILVEVPPGRGQDLTAWLSRFIITRDVHIEDQSASLEALQTLGPEIPRHLTTLVQDPLPTERDHHTTHTFDGAELLAICDGDYGVQSHRWVGPKEAIAALSEELRAKGLAELALAALEDLRIRAGTPRFEVDLGADVLPEEAGQKERAVSFTKGCYCGQEVVAKQHFLGRPRKRLVQLSLRSEVSPVGHTLCDEAKDLGKVRSATTDGEGRWIALAILKGADHSRSDSYTLNAPQLNESTPE